VTEPKMPEHIHDDDGTVEGCPGCFAEPPLGTRLFYEAMKRDEAIEAERRESAIVQSPDMITELRPGQIIVVGTNIRGLHASGAAWYAHQHFGLRWGVGQGLSGQTYALPTMEGWNELRLAAALFCSYAALSHDLTFLLTKVGCGIAGYEEEKVSALFAKAPVNVLRPTGWPPFKGKPIVHPEPYQGTLLKPKQAKKHD